MRIQKIKQIHIKLDSALHKKLKVLAAINDVTIQELVVTMIEEKIKKSQLDKLPSKKVN